MAAKEVAKITVASLFVCSLTIFDFYLWWFISLFFDDDLSEMILHRPSAGHAIAESVISYAVVFPVTVIIISRIFHLEKGDVKYVFLAALALSILRFICLVTDILRTSNPIGYTASLIVLASVSYLSTRINAETLPRWWKT